jgi:hypothetical protein
MVNLASWTAPTYANPMPGIQRAFAEIKRRTEKGLYSQRSFRQEWLAEFVEDGALFQNIEALSTAKRTEAIPNHTYVIGVDWARAAGGDFTVFCVLDITAKAQAELERTSGAPYDVQLAKLTRLWERYNRPAILAEYNSMGGPLVEQMQIKGLPVTGFTTTAQTKHEIITARELALDRKEITLINDPAQQAELSAFERKERMGVPSYGAPEGMHDDTVIALALAWWAGGGATTWFMT